MIFTKEQIIEAAKVLNFGEKGSGLFLKQEIQKLKAFLDDILVHYNNHINDPDNEELKEKYRNSYLNAYSFYSNEKPYYYIALVRALTNANINVTYKVVPEFKEHVKNYKSLLICARQVKFDKDNNIINIDVIKDTSVFDHKPDLYSSVLEVIKFSKELGNKGTSPKREQSAVQAKLIEEVGEHSVEIQIQNGITYKDAGVDGIAGEAVDIAICAIDSFALEYPDKSPEEIFGMFQTYMSTKLAKWKRTV